MLECAVRNYAGLIIKHGKEEDVLNGYLVSGTEIYSSLILQIGRGLEGEACLVYDPYGLMDAKRQMRMRWHIQ